MVKLNIPKFVSQTSMSGRLASDLKSEALPALDARGCFSGWLNKKSHSKMVANTFQKRFFVLSNDALSYAKKPEALEVEGELTEHPLSELEWVKLGKEKSGKEFEVSFKSRVLHLEAPDSASAQQWVSHIQQAAHTAKGEDLRSSSRARRTSSIASKVEESEFSEMSSARRGRFSGWLNKKTHNKMVANTFQKRFFVLSNDALSYAKKPEAVEVEGELTEHPLSELEWVKLLSESACTFEVSFKSRVLHLEAPDSNSAQQWVSHIQQAAQVGKGIDQRSASRPNPTSNNGSKEEEAFQEVVSAQGSRFSGWLSKKSHNKMVANTFQKRFFILSNNALSYAKKPEALEVEGELTEHFLSELEWVKFCGEEDVCKEFEVSFKSRVLHLKAPDSASAQQWVSHIEQAALSSKGKDQGSTPRPNPTSSMASKESEEPKQEVVQFQADASQHRGNDVVKLHSGRAEAVDSSDEGSDQVPPQPPPTRRHSIYKSLNHGLNLDLDTEPQQQEDEEASQQEEQQQHKPPSPRSMLASPARFSSMPSQSPRQHSRTKQDLHQLNERASVRSCSRPSDAGSDGDVGSPVETPKQPHPFLGHSNPLYVPTKPPSSLEHQSEALGSPAYSPRMQASHQSRLTSSEGRPASALSRSFLHSSHASLRPRLLQPDAPLPEAVPKPGLHHAIALQKAHNSRGSSARSGEGAEQGSERLELAPPSAAYKDNSSMGSRGINHAKPSDPESETLVLGPSVLERRAAPAADAVTERIGSRSSTPHASLHSSMQSSMGSARNAAPRLLSGAAASRAPPPPLVEGIELPPPNYPKHPLIPRPTPATADSGRFAQRNAADHQGGGVDRTELEENWDSEEEEQGPAGEQLSQHPQPMPTQNAKSHFRVPQGQQQQQQQGWEIHHSPAAGNSWDDDDDDNGNGGAQHGHPKLAVPAPPPSGRSRPARPVPSAAPHSSSAAAARQQQMLRQKQQQQEQQRQRQEQDVVAGVRDVHASHAPHVPAGVTEDKNWVEENWDSDEE